MCFIDRWPTPWPTTRRDCTSSANVSPTSHLWSVRWLKIDKWITKVATQVATVCRRWQRFGWLHCRRVAPPNNKALSWTKKVNQLSSLSLHFDDRLPLRRKLDRQGGPPRPHPTLIRVICLWMSAASRHIQWTTPHSNEHVETLFIFFQNSFSHFETKWTLNDSSAPRGTSSKLIIAGLFLSQFYFYLHHSIALLMLYKLSFESNLIRLGR